MGKEARCGPEARIRRRKNWFMHLVVATVVGAALLVLGSHGGSQARAQTASAVLVGAGDIASCESRGDRATAKLLDSIRGTVFTAGDNVYGEKSSLEDFDECYGRTWGHYKERTKPVVGNHEYLTRDASGYFRYFGQAAGEPEEGYYSYNRRQWHIVALNSECKYVRGGCDRDSPMVRWLKKDLAANPARCTLAYFHRPLFSSGQNGNDPAVRPIWHALHAADADVVVNGHDHVYERFARQTPRGELDKQGIREFVVGTGGASHGKFRKTKDNSQVRNAHTYGVLKLTLYPTYYSWKFVPIADKTFTDSGSTYCR
jgi:predicted phosphodiesterase